MSMTFPTAAILETLNNIDSDSICEDGQCAVSLIKNWLKVSGEHVSINPDTVTAIANILDGYDVDYTDMFMHFRKAQPRLMVEIAKFWPGDISSEVPELLCMMGLKLDSVMLSLETLFANNHDHEFLLKHLPGHLNTKKLPVAIRPAVNDFLGKYGLPSVLEVLDFNAVLEECRDTITFMGNKSALFQSPEAARFLGVSSTLKLYGYGPEHIVDFYLYYYNDERTATANHLIDVCAYITWCSDTISLRATPFGLQDLQEIADNYLQSLVAGKAEPILIDDAMDVRVLMGIVGTLNAKVLGDTAIFIKNLKTGEQKALTEDVYSIPLTLSNHSLPVGVYAVERLTNATVENLLGKHRVIALHELLDDSVTVEPNETVYINGPYFPYPSTALNCRLGDKIQTMGECATVVCLAETQPYLNSVSRRTLYLDSATVSLCAAPEKTGAQRWTSPPRIVKTL